MATSKPFGRLEKIDLRQYWKREATDFTPWLAKEENIQLLGETIGIDLEVQGQEESVGPFSADILCKDLVNDHYVLIENQLERTDHTHLGQLMTYAAGLDAVTIIWIAQSFTEEHRAALDWLNRITDETFTFFGIEIELYRIGNSEAAPLFKVVSKPNDWSKQVKRNTNNQNTSETKLLQGEYWQALKDFVEAKKSQLRMQAPAMKHWTNLSLGRSSFWLSALVNSREKTISIWLNIAGPDAKRNFDNLKATAFEGSLIEISKDLVWNRLEDRKMCAVTLTISNDFADKSSWASQFAWFCEYLEKFDKYFRPLIQTL